MEHTRACSCFETTFSFLLTQHYSGWVVHFLSSDYGPGSWEKWQEAHLLPCEKKFPELTFHTKQELCLDGE